MYADDLVLLSPCKIGLSRLLKCCDDYAVSHDIVYNGSKSYVLICSPNKTVSTDPVFHIQNNLIVRKPKAKYLGHIISEDICLMMLMYFGKLNICTYEAILYRGNLQTAA